MIKVDIKFLPGTDIESAAVAMMDAMNPKNFIFGGVGVQLAGEFNGITLTAQSGTCAKDIIDFYYKEMHRRDQEADVRRKKLILFGEFERVAYKNFFDKVNADANLPQRTINDLCMKTMENLEAEKKRLGVE